MLIIVPSALLLLGLFIVVAGWGINALTVNIGSTNSAELASREVNDDEIEAAIIASTDRVVSSYTHDSKKRR